VRAMLAQTRMEIRLTLRRFEAVLITMVVPVVLLVFFGMIGLAPDEYERPIDFLLPGMLVLAIMSTGLVSLSIRTAYERSYGVLKRLGTTPLSRSSLVIAKINSVVLVALAEIVILVAIAIGLFGWTLQGNWAVALVTLLIGTAAFAGFGLLLAGALRAETTLATANTLYLFFLLFGGIVWPLDRMPGALAAIASIMPSSAFTIALRDSLTPGPAGLPILELGILVAWTAGAIAAATYPFEWE
jgi:ABC-2 type transport system permease protein